MKIFDWRQRLAGKTREKSVEMDEARKARTANWIHVTQEHIKRARIVKTRTHT